MRRREKLWSQSCLQVHGQRRYSECHGQKVAGEVRTGAQRKSGPRRGAGREPRGAGWRRIFVLVLVRSGSEIGAMNLQLRGNDRHEPGLP